MLDSHKFHDLVIGWGLYVYKEIWMPRSEGFGTRRTLTGKDSVSIVENLISSPRKDLDGLRVVSSMEQWTHRRLSIMIALPGLKIFRSGHHQV
jgi:hypothetical protein